MKSWKTRYVAIIAVATLFVGYLFGTRVGAGNALPGTHEDPLVSRSYVDDRIDSKYNELREQVGQLLTQVEELEKEIASLSGDKRPNPKNTGASEDIKLTIGSRTAYIGDTAHQLEAAPTIHQGYTLLPLRFVGEALGAYFDYSQAEQAVTFKTDEHDVSLKLGSKTAFVDGQRKSLEVPPYTFAGRTLVPVRFVSESLGAYVDWDGDKQTVTITP